MKQAKIYNDCTGEYIYFDYDKVLEADAEWDNMSEAKKQQIVSQLKNKIKKFYEEE